jgi:ATP-dependent Lon protease
VLEVALETKPVPLTDEEVTVVAAPSTDKGVGASAAADGLKH